MPALPEDSSIEEQTYKSKPYYWAVIETAPNASTMCAFPTYGQAFRWLWKQASIRDADT